MRDAEGKEIRVDLEMLNGQLSYVRLKPIMSIPVPEAFPVETEVAELTDEDGS